MWTCLARSFVFIEGFLEWKKFFFQLLIACVSERFIMEAFRKKMESEGFEVTLVKKESGPGGKEGYTCQLQKKIRICAGPHYNCSHHPPGIYSATNEALESLTLEVSRAAGEVPHANYTIEKADVTLL